jgi:magnesium chelatase family protein
MIERYRRRLSGPLLDRIDLHIEVPRVPHRDLADPVDGESSATIRARVEAARQIQRERFAALSLHANAHMQARHIRRFCPIDDAGQKLLEMVTDRLGLSARSYSRTWQYRGLDRKIF